MGIKYATLLILSLLPKVAMFDYVCYVTKCKLTECPNVCGVEKRGERRCNAVYSVLLISSMSSAARYISATLCTQS